MRRIAPLLLASTLAAACGQGEPRRPDALESENAKANYSVGYQIGGDFKRQGIPLEASALVAGIQDGIEGGEALLSEEDRRETLTDLKRRIVATEQASRQAEGEKNLAAAKTFLEANRAKEGVQTLPSGLQYKVLTEGKGPKPSATDAVKVHYRGKLIDGTEFDSSYSRNEPATFTLDRVIKGWTEALQLMGEGAKWELYIPPDLAYGERGAGSRIPPQSALVFEVELLAAKAE
jgi:FKBP-type peptidyl-prolyl cis-trans isomerase FklB